MIFLKNKTKKPHRLMRLSLVPEADTEPQKQGKIKELKSIDF